MMKTPTIGLVVASAFAVGCGPAAPAGDVAAELADQAVPYAEFEAYLAASAIADGPSLESPVLSGLFDQFLEELLLTRLAEEEGIEASGRQARVSALVSRESADINQQELAEYYRANPAKFLQPERVHLRQILVEERSAAEQAAREISRGASFESAAKQFSAGPRADFGGDQGILSREDLPPELAAQIFALDSGEVSGIIEADYGFHIFQVEERMPETSKSLEEAAPAIVEELREVKRASIVASLLDRAVKRYNLRVHAGNLPFQYQGKYV